jgi:hypothetical protein
MPSWIARWIAKLRSWPNVSLAQLYYWPNVLQPGLAQRLAQTNKYATGVGTGYNANGRRRRLLPTSPQRDCDTVAAQRLKVLPQEPLHGLKQNVLQHPELSALHICIFVR